MIEVLELLKKKNHTALERELLENHNLLDKRYKKEVRPKKASQKLFHQTFKLERPVYPGTCSVICMHVMKHHTSYAEATKKRSNGYDFIGHPEVPGAGCAVANTRIMMKLIHTGDLKIQDVQKWAIEDWKAYVGHQKGFKDRIEEGIAQIKRTMPLFIHMANKWDWT
ncbi:MAG: hypothetical protein AAGM67_08110 [Bacteroidota bacterium]